MKQKKQTKKQGRNKIPNWVLSQNHSDALLELVHKTENRTFNLMEPLLHNFCLEQYEYISFFRMFSEILRMEAFNMFKMEEYYKKRLC